MMTMLSHWSIQNQITSVSFLLDEYTYTVQIHLHGNSAEYCTADTLTQEKIAVYIIYYEFLDLGKKKSVSFSAHVHKSGLINTNIRKGNC